MDGPQVPGDHDATDVHDELDLLTILSVGKAASAPRKSAARETRSLARGQKRGRSIQKSARSIRSADAKRSGFGREAE